MSRSFRCSKVSKKGKAGANNGAARRRPGGAARAGDQRS